MINKLKHLPKLFLGYGIRNPDWNGEYKWYKKFIKPNMTIIEVGAYIGEHILQYCRHKNLTIHAFEPTPSTFKVLNQNLQPYQNQHKLYLNNIGLSNNIHKAEMYVYNEQLCGANSLYLYPSQIQKNPNYQTIQVQLDTLDNYMTKYGIEKIDFMKIDAEGHELAILQGCKDALQNGKISAIQFESSNIITKIIASEIFDLLTHYHFKFYRIAYFGLVPLQKNTLLDYQQLGVNYVAFKG